MLCVAHLLNNIFEIFSKTNSEIYVKKKENFKTATKKKVIKKWIQEIEEGKQKVHARACDR